MIGSPQARLGLVGEYYRQDRGPAPLQRLAQKGSQAGADAGGVEDEPQGAPVGGQGQEPVVEGR